MKDAWLAVACDGVWDVLTLKSIANVINRNMGAGLKSAAEKVVMAAKAHADNKDDISVVIAKLSSSKPFDKKAPHIKTGGGCSIM